MRPLFLFLCLMMMVARAAAQVPQIINYQGRVAVGTTNFNGSGSFKFALVNTNGTTSYWSNDGTSTAGSQPTAAVSLTVTKGLFFVLLGDTTITNMTVIPATVFNNADVRLRVWFNDGTNGFQLLTPDQRLASAGYAMIAGTVADGSITSAKIANGAVGSAQIASGVSITGTLTGNASTATTATSATTATTATNFSGSLTGDVTGTQNATVVAKVGTSTAANVHAAELIANAATNLNTSNAIVKRDASGNFTAGTISVVADIALPTTGSAAAGAITQNGSVVFHTFGSQNLFIGSNAGNFTTTGSGLNVGIGASSLNLNTTGFGNTALGFGSLNQNTKGNGNTAVGLSALAFNTTANGNTAIGDSALITQSYDFGGTNYSSNNTAVGFSALTNNQPTTPMNGVNNSAVGFNALAANTIGANNSALGSSALAQNTTADNNTALGYKALTVNTDGVQNTACGSQAMISNTDGNLNTACGAFSLNFNTTGSQNTATGAGAMELNTVGSDNTATGYGAMVSNSTAGQNVAIGSNALFNQTYNNSGTAWSSNNVAVGYAALLNNQPTSTANGLNNTALGTFALKSNTTGANNTALGSNAGLNLTTGSNNIDIGNTGVAGESNIIRIGTSQTDTFLTGVIHGNGSGLTGLPAANLTGTVSGSQLASGLTLSGTTSGTFSGPLTGNVTGNVTGTAASFTGSLTGDVTGTQGATVVAKVGTSTAANVHAAELLANAATNANTVNAIVKRDASGNFSAGTVTLAGGLKLPNTSSATTGVIIQNGTVMFHSFGTDNLFVGDTAGNFALTGADNVGIGVNALTADTTGHENIAIGSNSLLVNTTGNRNVSIGHHASDNNLNGSDNVALGGSALLGNTSGSQNVAIGLGALATQSFDNGGTSYNTRNTAVGWEALLLNQPTSTSTGTNNTAFGYSALNSNTTGSFNIALGSGAGGNLTTGDSNIDIGHAGVGGESATIRIGTSSTQTRTFIAGISGATSSGGVAVFVNSSGQLGTTTSSRRFKDDIQTMGAASEVLYALRPVSFHYKPELDANHIPQFGLIAEEVNDVMPDLVIRDGDGQIQTVRYEQINAMLLNEFLKDHRRAQALDKRVGSEVVRHDEEMKKLRAENEALKDRLRDLEAKDKDREERLAKLEQLLLPHLQTATADVTQEKGN